MHRFGKVRRRSSVSMLQIKLNLATRSDQESQEGMPVPKGGSRGVPVTSSH